MNFSLSELKSIAKVLSTTPNASSALSKLASIDVLKSLGKNNYTIMLNNKTLNAYSDKPLTQGDKYWSLLSHTEHKSVKLTQLLKMPSILQSLKTSHTHYSLKDLQTILSSKNPSTHFKQHILEQLGKSSTKEEFSNISTLLLSLQNQVFTIPLLFHNYFSILQFKKRYNKKTKKTQIDFYAALEALGPISGLIAVEQTNVEITLNVAFETTKTFLENDMKNFSYDLNIDVSEGIEPLYHTNINSLLDISI